MSVTNFAELCQLIRKFKSGDIIETDRHARARARTHTHTPFPLRKENVLKTIKLNTKSRFAKPLKTLKPIADGRNLGAFQTVGANSVAFSPQANYIDRATAACWRS
jgi:hypothetical protein